MHTLAERKCSKCEMAFFTRRKNSRCPVSGCTGIMCAIIRPIPGEYVSGVLCRDRTAMFKSEVTFFPNTRLDNIILDSDGVWISGTFNSLNCWTKEQWKEQYGRLPRKGSKEMILLELSNV